MSHQIPREQCHTQLARCTSVPGQCSCFGLYHRTCPLVFLNVCCPRGHFCAPRESHLGVPACGPETPPCLAPQQATEEHCNPLGRTACRSLKYADPQTRKLWGRKEGKEKKQGKTKQNKTNRRMLRPNLRYSRVHLQKLNHVFFGCPTWAEKIQP